MLTNVLSLTLDPSAEKQYGAHLRLNSFGTYIVQTHIYHKQE